MMNHHDPPEHEYFMNNTTSGMEVGPSEHDKRLEKKVKTLEAEVAELKADVYNIKQALSCPPTARSRGGYWEET